MMIRGMDGRGGGVKRELAVSWPNGSSLFIDGEEFEEDAESDDGGHGGGYEGSSGIVL